MFDIKTSLTKVYYKITHYDPRIAYIILINNSYQALYCHFNVVAGEGGTYQKLRQKQMCFSQ